MKSFTLYRDGYVTHSRCWLCVKFPYEEKSFYCAERGKVVWKTTGLRNYCFNPIDDVEYIRRINYSKEKLHKQVLHHKKLFRLRHLDHINEYMKKWREDNRELLLAGKKDHYNRNKERYRENARRWEKSNPDKVREYNAIKAVLRSLDPVQCEISIIRTYRKREEIAKAKASKT